MKKLKDITLSAKELEKYHIENNILKSVDVALIAHFGNSMVVEMWFENCQLFGGYNLGGLSYDIIRTIVELLDLSEEDGVRLSQIKDVPVRIVLNCQFGRVIGFGHFMKDKFVLAEDVISMAKENWLEAKGNDK